MYSFGGGRGRKQGWQNFKFMNLTEKQISSWRKSICRRSFFIEQSYNGGFSQMIKATTHAVGCACAHAQCFCCHDGVMRLMPKLLEGKNLQGNCKASSSPPIPLANKTIRTNNHDKQIISLREAVKLRHQRARDKRSLGSKFLAQRERGKGREGVYRF